MIDAFLQRQGLVRMHQIFAQRHTELSGLLFGQLFNCALYSRESVRLDRSLVGVSFSCSLDPCADGRNSADSGHRGGVFFISLR